MIYIFWTCETTLEAEKIVRGLLKKHLIACANILPEVHSFYWWEDEIEESTEVKVLLKTDEKHFDSIEAYIKEHASYNVPEITQVKIEKAHMPYQKWLAKQVSS